MEPATCQVTISDQRSYIKIENFHGHLTEIHGALSEVCGEFTEDQSTVSRWANRFHGGCVSTYNDPRLGSPTDERSVKLVANALEEDRCATCEELCRATGVPATSVFRILTNDLKKRKIFCAMSSSLIDC